MKRLLAQAQVEAQVTYLLKKPATSKPSIKELRTIKPLFDAMLERDSFDYVIAAGETAARLVLDTSSVNISKLRGRDIEYVVGVKTAKRAKGTSSASTEE